MQASSLNQCVRGTPAARAAARVPAHRVCVVPRATQQAAPETGLLSKLFSKKKKMGENLEDRIASGEFTDTGSTKERLTRPVRKVLAQDPSGFGEQGIGAVSPHAH